MKYLNSFLLILCIIIASSSILQAQGGRQLGARRFILDNNDGINANQLYLIDVSGSMGIDNSGSITGTYPNTTALLSLLAGAKTTNLRIDGGSVWGIDVVNTNNSIRTSGSNILGSAAGNVSTTININGTGNLTLAGITAPALPSPLSNLLYLNVSNQVRQTPGGVNIVTGSGTLNTVPLWTPTGFQLGNSILTQPNTSAMAITPTAGGTNVLTVNNFDATSTALKINANGGTGINVDPASTGISLQATNTGINFATAPTTGINLQATTTGITGSITGASGVNVAGSNYTVNASGTGIATGVGATATTTGSAAPIGVSGTANASGAGATNFVFGGSFTGNGAANTAEVVGVQGLGTATNGSASLGGRFQSSGSSGFNIGVATFNAGGTGQNIGFLSQSSGTNSVDFLSGFIFSPSIGLQVVSATTAGVSIAGAPTALTVASGNIILGSTVNTIASGGTIPAGWSVVDVNNNPGFVATVTLPAGAVNGQVCYITTEDPLGVKITVGLASVTISNAEVGRFMFINGTWRLEH